MPSANEQTHRALGSGYRESNAKDYAAGCCLMLLCMLTYSYFFQGGGWNQNSQLDLVRALVEQHSCVISQYSSNTGDISVSGEHVFSNKAPGLAFALAVPYALLLFVETMLGFDSLMPGVVQANAHILTVLGSAFPAAVLALVLFRWFRAERCSRHASMVLAGCFAFGTLVFPYSGALMNHNVVAVCLFWAWCQLAHASCAHKRNVVSAGLCSGFALCAEYASLPAVALMAALAFIKTRSVRCGALFFIGPALGVFFLIAYQKLCFGQIGASSYSLTTKEFLDENLFLGLFQLPQIELIYYLTFHPMKGLFFCCPVLAFALAYPFWKRKRAEFLQRPEIVVAALVVLYFLVLNLAMKTWTAGWGVGPRYMLPMLPFLFIFVRAVWDWSRVVFMSLAIPSITFMSAVAAVGTFMPVPNTWPAPVAMPHPLRWVVRWLSDNQVAVSTQSIFERLPSSWDPLRAHERWDSYNIGELLGLNGLSSLLPLALMVVVLIALCRRFGHER